MKGYENIDSAGFRERRSQVFSRILDRYSDDADVETPESRLKLFRTLGSDNFVAGLTATNRLLAKNHELDQANNFFTDRPNAIASPNDPNIYQGMSLPEDKEPLLNYLYDYCIELADRPGEDLGHIATVLGCGINIIHPYIDANGRTARAAYDLLTKNPDVWHESLQESSRDELSVAYRLNTAHSRDFVYMNMALSLNTHSVELGNLQPCLPSALKSENGLRAIMHNGRTLNSDDAGLVIGIMNDKNLRDIIPARLVGEYGSAATERATVDYNGQKLFCMDVFMQESDDIDMHNLRYTYREIVNMYFFNLIEIVGGTLKCPAVPAETVEYGLIKIDIPSLLTKLASGELTLPNNSD